MSDSFKVVQIVKPETYNLNNFTIVAVIVYNFTVNYYELFLLVFLLVIFTSNFTSINYMFMFHDYR